MAREVILDLARKDGERWSTEFGNDPGALGQVSQVWAAGGGLDLQPLKASAERLEFNVTRCGYSEY